MQTFRNQLKLFSKLIKQKKKSCTLTIKSYSKVAYLYFSNGELIEAVTNTLKGKEAVLDIMLWDKIACELKNGCKYGENRIGSSLSHLLLESDRNIGKNVIVRNREIKNGEEEVIMSRVWDALAKIKEGQEEKKELGIKEKMGSDTKVAPEELASNLSKEQEKEEEMANPKEAQIGINTDGSMSRIDKLNRVLSDLKTITGDIEACAVASEDGLIMASNLPSGLEESNIAAMCAVMLSMGERTSAELERGTAEQLFIKGDTGYIVAMRAGENAVLMVIARKESKLGLIFLDLSRAAKKVEQILS